MTATEAQILFSVLTVFAILVAPFIAVQASEKLRENKEIKKRKLDIFRDLMATRATGLSPKHVEALNRIDVEFYGSDKKSRNVVNAWKEYHDHLSMAHKIESDDTEGWKAWDSKKEDYLTNLLYQMALFFGYEFDSVHIKRGHYYPKGFADIETEQMIIRKGLVEIFTDKKPFPVVTIILPTPEKKEGGVANA